jgi:hypothetical protein
MGYINIMTATILAYLLWNIIVFTGQKILWAKMASETYWENSFSKTVIARVKTGT